MWAFENWNDFWHMGGYAAYVWSAIFITLIVFKTLLSYVLIKHVKTKRRLMATLFQKET